MPSATVFDVDTLVIAWPIQILITWPIREQISIIHLSSRMIFQRNVQANMKNRFSCHPAAQNERTTFILMDDIICDTLFLYWKCRHAPEFHNAAEPNEFWRSKFSSANSTAINSIFVCGIDWNCFCCAQFIAAKWHKIFHDMSIV